MLLIVALFAVAMGLMFWAGRCSAPQRDYLEAPLADPHITPPDTVRLTKVATVLVQDLSWRKRYDSLKAVYAGNVDTMATYLARPWRDDHRWRIARNGLLAAGDLHIGVDPVSKTSRPVQTLDTLSLPPPVIRWRTEWPIAWMVAEAALVFLLGWVMGNR